MAVKVGSTVGAGVGIGVSVRGGAVAMVGVTVVARPKKSPALILLPSDETSMIMDARTMTMAAPSR